MSVGLAVTMTSSERKVRLLAETMRGRKVSKMEELTSGSYTAGGGIHRIKFEGERGWQVLKCAGIGLDMDKATALRVHGETVQFYNTQREIGILVPSAEFTIAKFDRHWVLVEMADYHGASLESRVVNNPHAVESYLEQVLAHVIGPIVASSPDGYHVGPIGLDPLLRNLCFIGKAGVPGNIDHVPAKLFRSPTDFTLELPEPTDLMARQLGYIRHYTLSGLIFSLFLNVVRLYPQAYDMAQAKIARFLQKRRRTEILDQIPDVICSTYAFDEKSEFLQVLPDLHPGNYSVLRQMAAWAAFRNGRLRPALEKLFRLTHFGSSYLTSEQFEAARSHVQAMLSKVE